ncbi:MAG: hypothetical protein FD156_954 [Nitrospirae bacterium]|nr:MAG: hypothetical protein FD156_954 [Nitrospirota bacterium]
MNKIITWIMLFILTMPLTFLQGCATDKPFVKKSMAPALKIKAVRCKTPTMQVRTFGKALFLIIPIAGGLAAGALATAHGAEVQQYLPNYGLLVMQSFTNHANQEIKLLPPIVMREQPVEDDYVESNVLLEIKINQIAYAYLVGIVSDSTITMKDSTGEVLWRRSFTYKSSDFDRKKSFEEFEADDYKLLKEEFKFAAEKTASDFIDHFKKEGTD